MVKVVICRNDKNLPQGAILIEGNKYTVIDEYMNQFEQKTYILKEVVNEGVTPRGLRWKGYRADRFEVDSINVKEIINKKYNFVLN